MALKNSCPHAAEDVAVDLAYQERFQRTPQTTGAQVRLVIRGQDHVSRFATGLELVRAAKGADATFDAQALLDDLESEHVWRLDSGDALCQIPSPVGAADRRANASLVAFGSDWVG